MVLIKIEGHPIDAPTAYGRVPGGVLWSQTLETQFLSIIEASRGWVLTMDSSELTPKLYQSYIMVYMF